VPAIVMFSHSGKPTGIIITTTHYLKHPAGWKSARNLSVHSQQNH